MENKLLTICIPTYKRAKELDYSLSCFERELKTVDASLLEFFISDNCSPDNTGEVVDKYIKKGLPIIYSRNDTNIGPDNNFLKCFYAAKSKYLWLLGDDDYLLEGKLKVILDILQTNDIGCLNLKNPQNCANGVYKLSDNQKYLTKIGHFFTFMSANIVRADSVLTTKINEELRSSNLLQMPFFVDSTLSMPDNVFVKDEFFEKSDNDNNGGYNFFNVFVKNYLEIWKSYRKAGRIRWFTYWTIKRRLLWNFVMPFIVYFHIQKRYPNMEKKKEWSIFFNYYWYEIYTYLYFLKIPYILFKSKMQKGF